MKAITAQIVLPLRFNANARGRRRKVPTSVFRETGRELALHFGGCTNPRGEPFTGYWTNAQGTVDEDDNTYLEVMDLGPWDLGRLHEFCREVLLDRFEQEAILVKFLAPPKFGALVTKKG